MTSAAAMLATWGTDTDPHRLNQWLKSNRGYANGNLMTFSALVPFGVHFVAFIRCATTPAPMQQLIQAVQGGAGVLACVDWQPGAAVQPHWVYVTGLSQTDGQIMDPWQLPGREFISLKTYLAPGWDAARGIFNVAIYRRSRIEGQAPGQAPGQTLPQPWAVDPPRPGRKSRAIVQDSLCQFRKV